MRSAPAFTIGRDEAMLAAGATGYLLEENAAEELVAAVRAVVGRKTYLSTELEQAPTEPESGLWGTSGRRLSRPCVRPPIRVRHWEGKAR